MSRRLKITILIIGIIIVIALIIYFVSLFRAQFAPEEPIANVAVGTGTAFPEVPPGQPLGIIIPVDSVEIPEKDSDEKTKADLMRMAMSFVERFGSYSNQSNYNNIEDLMVYMSSDMVRWAEGHIKKERSRKKDTSIYFGVSTDALSSQVKKFEPSAGMAEFKISTQKRESSGSVANAKVYYQDILVSLVKENGVWKVDSAFWQ